MIFKMYESYFISQLISFRCFFLITHISKSIDLLFIKTFKN